MNREFFINILFLVGINLLIKPLYIFGVDLTVQNTVGPERYGLFFALFNFTYLFQIINDFGIQNYNNRLIAQHRSLVHRFLPRILSLKLVLALLYFAAILLGARLAGYGQQYDRLLLMIGGIHLIFGVLFYMRTNLSGLGFYRRDSIISALDKLLMILLCGVLLGTPRLRAQFRIEWFIGAQTLSYLLSIGWALVFLGPRVRSLRLRFEPRFWRLILRESYPFALVIFLMTLYTRIDGVMIERLLANGEYEAGVYAAGYRLLDALNMIGFLFAGLLLPMFARLLKEGQPVAPLAGFSFRLIWAGSITAAASAYFFQQPVMQLLYTGADAYWGEVMGILLLTFVAVSGTYIWGTLLTANGNLRLLNRLLLLGVVGNVVLNLALIPTYRALGAAVATVLTQFALLLAQLILAQRAFGLDWRWGAVARVGGFAGLTVMAAYGCSKYLPFDWFVNFCLSICLGLLIALAFRMIHPRQLSTFLRSS